jgi:uncharacterized phage infection (PIP) family protein YhgE
VIDFGTVAATALINAVIGVGIWGVVTRTVNRRDKEVDELQNEVKDLRDEKLVVITAALNDGKESRRTMHSQIDTMARGLDRHDEQIQRLRAEHDTLRDTAMKLAAVSERVTLSLDRIEALSAQQTILSEKMAATAALVNRGQRG